jgi:hypothetical protein
MQGPASRKQESCTVAARAGRNRRAVPYLPWKGTDVFWIGFFVPLRHICQAFPDLLSSLASVPNIIWHLSLLSRLCSCPASSHTSCLCNSFGFRPRFGICLVHTKFEKCMGNILCTSIPISFMIRKDWEVETRVFQVL